jgi:hypothetical protein
MTRLVVSVFLVACGSNRTAPPQATPAQPAQIEVPPEAGNVPAPPTMPDDPDDTPRTTIPHASDRVAQAPGDAGMPIAPIAPNVADAGNARQDAGATRGDAGAPRIDAGTRDGAR